MSTAVRDGARYKHGTRVRFILSAGGQVLEDEVIDLELLGAHLTVKSFMYNGLTMSGGVAWRHPSSGRSLKRPSWTAELVDPADELVGGQLCDCSTCLEGES